MTQDVTYHWSLTCQRATRATCCVLSADCTSFDAALRLLVREYCRETTETWDSIQLTPVEVPHARTPR